MNKLNPKGAIEMKGAYSRFSMRMKAVSISLLMIFFSQQVSWACAGNLFLLVNLPPSPLIYQDHGEFNRLVAKRVYSLIKPSFRDKAQELKSVYQWLKQPSTQTVPCSAYVLYNLLQAKGIKPKIEDISASLISLDLKAGNLKPPFTASRIDNSLYALAKTAESQGLHLYPARLNSITPELLNSLNSLTPFIAHLNYSEALDKGHFVLVTGIDADKAHFFYDKGDTFLPLEKFLEEFSGYCLISAAVVVAAHCAATTVSDVEAKAVLGAKSYKGVRVDYTKLFKEPSTKDLLIGFGVSVGTMFGGSMLSGMMKGQGLSFGKAFAGFGTGIAQGEISKASVNFGVQQFKMKPLYAQIVGFGVSGAMSGAIAGIGNDTQFTIGKVGEVGKVANFWNNHSIMRGAIMGTVQGGMQGTGSVMAYQGIKNTSFYKKNPFIARQVAGLVGGAVGYMGFYAMTGAMRMNVNIDKNNNKVFEKEQKGTQVTYSDGSTRIRMSTFDNGGAGILNNVKFALADSSFLSSMISQGTALGVEWAAGPKYAKYSRLLGQGIGSAAGGLATGNGISPWKMMMNGALSGGISLGLGYLGGEVGPDGKNKLGLTDIQMAGIEWMGTATLYSGIGAAMSKTPGTTFADAFGQRFSEFSTDYVSFGRTSPLYTKGAGGWSSFMYNQKIADFGGFANYKANADYSMKLQGYKSWSKFVDDGKAANLLPSFSNSLVRYASTSLHYGAVSNAIATVGWLPKSATNFLGIAKHEIINKKDSDIIVDILEEIATKKDNGNKLKTIVDEASKKNVFNNSSQDSKNSWIGISEVDSNVVVGRSFFTLGGSEVVYDKGEFVSLNHHLRRALEIDGTQVGSSLYHLGEEYNASNLQSLDGGSGGLLISTKRPGEAYTVNLFNFLAYAQDSGYVSGIVSESTRDGTEKFYRGRVSNKHEKGKPTITDIFTSEKVTPKKFWFDQKAPVNTGITLAVYNRPIDTNKGSVYLGKNKEGLYPAAGFGYSQNGKSVSIVTKDGERSGIFNNEMIVELSAPGQGVETKTTEDIMSVVKPEKKIEEKKAEVKPEEQKITTKDAGDKKKQGEQDLTTLEQKVKSAEENLEKVKKDYMGEEPSTLFITAIELLEEMPGGNIVVPYIIKPIVGNGEGDVRVNPKEKEGNLDKAMTALTNVTKELEDYKKNDQRELAKPAPEKDNKQVDTPEPVKTGEKITTITKTPKITTTITIKDLFDLSSRNSPEGFPIKVGGSAYSEVSDTKASSVPLSQTEVATPAKPEGGSGLPPELEALYKEFNEASEQLVNARTILDSVNKEANVNKDISAQDIKSPEKYLQESEERYAKANLALTQGLLESGQIVPYPDSPVIPNSKVDNKHEDKKRESEPVGGGDDYLRDIRLQAEEYVDFMSQKEGIFGSVPVNIKIPPHLLHNIGDQLTYKNKEDLVREIEFYNIKSLPPKSPVDLPIEDVADSQQIVDMDQPVVVLKSAVPVVAKQPLVSGESSDSKVSKAEPPIVSEVKSEDIKIITQELEQKNAEITEKVEGMSAIPLLNIGKRKEIDKLNQEKEKETRDAYKSIGRKRGMTPEEIALDTKIREAQDQVLKLQLDIQDRKDIKENSGWMWKGIDWAEEKIGAITPLADKERELKNREKVVINLQKGLLALKNGDKPAADKLNQNSIISTKKRGDKLFTEYSNGNKTMYIEKDGELTTLYPNGKVIIGNRAGDFSVKLPNNTYISNNGTRLPNDRMRDSEGILISPSMDWKDSFEKGANAVKATGTFVWSLMKWPVTREYPNFGKYGKSSE